MARINWIEDEEATGECAEIYAAWKKANPTRKRMPDILKAFSMRPDTLRAAIGMSYELHFKDGHLTWKTKELLATYVSALNRCPYCTTSHAYFLEVKDDRKAVVDAVSLGDAESAPVTREEKALLDFAKLLTESSWRVADEDVQRLRDVGWNDHQIAETVYVVGMFNLFNRVANAFGLPPSNFRQIIDKETVAKGFPNPEAKS